MLQWVAIGWEAGVREKRWGIIGWEVGWQESGGARGRGYEF